MSTKTEKDREALRAHKADIKRRVDGKDLMDVAKLAGSLSALRNDSWQNLVTGLGVAGRDKRSSTKVSWGGLLMNEHQAEATVAGNNLARRIVELLPYEATRLWVDLLNFDDEGRKVRDDMDRLNVRENFFTAWCWGRQFGGAGILMVTDEPLEAMEKPLVPERVGRLVNLVVFNRWELDAWSSDIEDDLTSPNFRKPRHYRLNSTSGGLRVPINMRIHNSRIIRFDGQPLSPLLFIRNKYWGDSIFSGLLEPMRDWDASSAGVAQVLEQFRFVVHSMPEIAEKIASGQHAKVMARVQAAAAGRNLTGTMIIDTEEKVESKSETFAGVPDILETLANRFAAHTEYPKIILYNQSPDGGLGSTGASEVAGWNATVQSRQATYLAPKLDRFLKVLLATRQGPVAGRPPEDWDYEFVALQQESAEKKATREKLEAEADDIRMDQGAQDVVDIMKRRFPDKLKGQDEAALRAKIEMQKQLELDLEAKRLAAAPAAKTGDKTGMEPDDDDQPEGKGKPAEKA